MAEQMRVTISDIAKRAGVSKATVSRVLNDKPDVDEATRRRILEIIQETGYTRQAAAVGLATGRTNLIGLLVPSLSRPYSIEVIQGVAQGLEEYDYELVLYTTSMAEKNQELFGQALSRNLVDGLLVLLPRNGVNYLAQLRASRFPVVLIDHRGVAADLPSVLASNRQGAREATHYLIELGHRRIAFITGLLDFGCSRDRLEGYKLALAEAGIPFAPELVGAGDFVEAGGLARAREWLAGPNPPTAIFASSDLMALGAMEAARQQGLRVPDDVSIVGFDDIPAAARALPALTTVKQPLQDMGRRAVDLLLGQIMGQKLEALEVELPTELIIRASCARCR
jgi:LacI family transcriptional regulator